MLREGIARLQYCRSLNAGANADEMAECFESWVPQISQYFDWDADHMYCADGSHLFAGEYGDAFAILPNTRIAFGQFGQYPTAMVNPSNGLALVAGKLVLEAPRLQFAKRIV